MAVRIQFRRGTAAEWASANPVLAAGELGYETDTTKFKLGDGTKTWDILSYSGVTQADVEAAVADVVGLAPADLDTLVELANAIGNDPAFITTIESDLATHVADTTNIHGIADTSALETKTGAQTKATNAQANAAAYTDNAIATLIDSAPSTLNTLNELAAALGDDPNYATTITTSLGGKLSFVIDTAANLSQANAVTTANTIYIESDTNRSFARVGDGITHYNDLAFLGKDYTDEQMTAHANLDTNVHGIADTADLETKTGAQDKADSAEQNAKDYSNTQIEALSTDTIEEGSLNLYYTSTRAEGDTRNVLAEVTDVGLAYDTVSQSLTVSTGTGLQLDTLNGTVEIDETVVVTVDGTQTLSNKTIHRSTNQITVSVADVEDLTATANELNVLDGVTATTAEFNVLDGITVTTTELNYVSGVTSGIQAQLDGKLASSVAATTYLPQQNPIASNLIAVGETTIGSINVIGQVTGTELNYVHGVTSAIQTQLNAKAPTANPTFTGTVSGVTKAMVGLGNVDNTADADKPVSTATQTALDLKANLAAPTFTGTLSAADITVSGNLVVNGSTTTVSSTNLEVTDPLIYIGTGNSANSKDLGLVGHFNNGTYQHTGIVRDATDGKWKLFSGVTTEPSDVIDFGTWTKDTLVLGALEATTVTPSSGVVFSDGTQTKVGVPSISAFTYKTASYTLDSLSLRDGIIEVANTSATTITIPADSSVDYPIGSSIDIIQTSTGQVTIAAGAGVTVNSTPGLKLRTQWSSATLLKRAANTWIVYGDLTA